MYELKHVLAATAAGTPAPHDPASEVAGTMSGNQMTRHSPGFIIRDFGFPSALQSLLTAKTNSRNATASAQSTIRTKSLRLAQLHVLVVTDGLH